MKNTEVLNKIESITKLIEKKKIDVVNSKNKLNPLVEKINLKYLSAAIEDVLLSLPYKATGSILYSKKLNTQASLYNDHQFNKIIRFLTFIEDSEKVYNTSYKNLSKEYLNQPIKKDAEDLITQHKLIHSEYKLIDILCNGIISDKVNFNKIYNNLEDKGVFLTQYEKINMEYLSSISKNIFIVVSQLNNINSTLNEVADSLWEINEEVSSMSYSLKEIDGGVKAGNFINAIQTYQLHKINKKIN